MTTAIADALKPTRSRVLTLVVILAILFGAYGLLSAQQAKSAGTLPKQVWGGIRGDVGSITHGKHITAVNHPFTGIYFIAFDRHVDNCSIQLTSRKEGWDAGTNVFWSVFPQSSNNEIEVIARDASAFRNSDFDIFGMCPSS
jgi:hypothetical protein